MTAIKELLHTKISENFDKIEEWFESKRKSDLQLPFYSSFDIRDSGYKVAPIDANLFPAGFNNICQVDKNSAVDLVEAYLQKHYKLAGNKILLVTEEHTQNAYYWDNVFTLKTLIEEAGYEVRLSFPNCLEAPIEVKSASGPMLLVEPNRKVDGELYIGDWKPDLVISNNDFSQLNTCWSDGLKVPFNPPSEMGWHRRKKSLFFEIYNELAEEFAKLIDIDPWQIQVRSESFKDFAVDDEDSRKKLADHCRKMSDSLREEMKSRGINEEPFLFIKNDSGTYGLGVIQVAKPEDVENWNYKSRKKMKAAKGGGGISQVLVQEGISTQVKGHEGQVAEPAIYMIGCQLAGGFLRTHTKKSETESLNSPGAVFQRLCVSDLKVKPEGSPQENAYGWIAKLAFLAVAEEAKRSGVKLMGYQ
ncbi:MAG TPA: glutamate--cysteine ligase [Bdellovibrionales bacterium]|nr:glutamate--cysteine ligase [Pseudobdellovibrionaceae bacterium]HAG91496.1 glutamate--cysteine ligase [Bdellovibrionales bacterium]|tara:strand:- start:30680 stop:31930 length:1251 start_codon:yes stop_codon:yes gene_type:complete